MNKQRETIKQRFDPSKNMNKIWLITLNLKNKAYGNLRDSLLKDKNGIVFISLFPPRKFSKPWKINE